jgi:tetratricopeptide (TPR) repeat protein
MSNSPDRSRPSIILAVLLFLIALPGYGSTQGELRKGVSGSGDGAELRLPNPPARRKSTSSAKPKVVTQPQTVRTPINTPAPPDVKASSTASSDLVDEEIELGNAARDRGNAKLDALVDSNDFNAVNASLPDYTAAAKHYRKAAEIDPADYRSYFGLGAIYVDKIQRHLTTSHEEAAKNFQMAIERNPASAESYVGLSYASTQLRNYQQSITAAQQAIRLKPDYAEAYYTLGSAYYSSDKHEDAIPAFKKALALKPTYARVYRVLGNVYLALRRHDERIANFKEWVRNSPKDPEAYMYLGSGYYSATRYEEAVPVYKQALQMKPNWSTVHYQLGLAYYRLGDEKSTMEQYQILQKLDPESANAFHRLINR